MNLGTWLGAAMSIASVPTLVFGARLIGRRIREFDRREGAKKVNRPNKMNLGIAPLLVGGAAVLFFGGLIILMMSMPSKLEG